MFVELSEIRGATGADVLLHDGWKKLVELLLNRAINCCRCLIEKDNARLNKEKSRECEALLLTCAKHVRPIESGVKSADALKHLAKTHLLQNSHEIAINDYLLSQAVGKLRTQ
jgi:hypothetical protein